MNASKLTDAQLEAAIRSSEATKAKNEAKGDMVNAGAAHARIVKNQAELARRRAARPGQVEIKAPPRPAAEIATSNDLTMGAMIQAKAMLDKWGPTITIRALHKAMREADPRPMVDVADGVRLKEITRRAEP